MEMSAETFDMADGQVQNGSARVRFGPGNTQVMPLEWAEMMLSAWRERSPKQFGDALARAALEAR